MIRDPLHKLAEDLHLKGLAKSTREEYTRCAAKFIEYHSSLEPEELGEAEARQFLLHRLANDRVGHATLKVNVAALRFFYANTLGRPDVAAMILYPKVKSALPDILSGTEVRSLLGAMQHPKYRAIIMTTYGAGLRISETCHLRVADIDSGRMVLHIRGGKGGRDRIVPLSPSVLWTLRSYWKTVRPGMDFLFPGKEPGQPISFDAVRHHLQEAAIQAGLQKRVTPHVLRHSFATHLLELGTDIRVIQTLLGHGSLQSTLRYARVTPAHAGRVRSPIDVLDTPEARAKLG